jgi:hypothetical protein
MELNYDEEKQRSPLDFRVVGIYSSLERANAATERFFENAFTQEELYVFDVDSEEDEVHDEKDGFEETTDGWFSYNAKYVARVGISQMKNPRTRLVVGKDGVMQIFLDSEDGLDMDCILEVKKYTVK